MKDRPVELTLAGINERSPGPVSLKLNTRGEIMNNRKMCYLVEILTLLSEFSSSIYKFTILLVPGTAKNTFYRLLGFLQTELRQSRENSPHGVCLNTSEVGILSVFCLNGSE
jgi:hypothetical protein